MTQPADAPRCRLCAQREHDLVDAPPITTLTLLNDRIAQVFALDPEGFDNPVRAYQLAHDLAHDAGLLLAAVKPLAHVTPETFDHPPISRFLRNHTVPKVEALLLPARRYARIRDQAPTDPKARAEHRVELAHLWARLTAEERREVDPERYLQETM